MKKKKRKVCLVPINCVYTRLLATPRSPQSFWNDPGKSFGKPLIWMQRNKKSNNIYSAIFRKNLIADLTNDHQKRFWHFFFLPKTFVKTKQNSFKFSVIGQVNKSIFLVHFFFGSSVFGWCWLGAMSSWRWRSKSSPTRLDTSDASKTSPHVLLVYSLSLTLQQQPKKKYFFCSESH